MRLIDADAIVYTHAIARSIDDGHNWKELCVTKDEIDDLPSAEPERKIIHCKDCKFAHLTTKGEVKYCDVWFPETKTYLSADDFCSSAEKRGE